MRYLAFVAIESFYVRVLAPEDSERVVVHEDGRVLDASREAAKKGIQGGMALSEARALLAGEGRLVEYVEERYRDAQRAWLDVAAEFSDAIEPVSPHEAYIDLSGHPRPRAVAQRMKETLRERLHHPVRLGLAPARWVARQAAIQDGEGELIRHPESFVAPLLTATLPIAPRSAERLILLGYPTVGQIARVGLETLRAQFGEEAHEIHRTARGGGEARVAPLWPPNSIAARFVYEGPPETIEELESGLRRLAREIAVALSDQDAVGERVELFFEHEDASVSTLARTFSKPIATGMDVLNALRLMIPTPPERPVEAVRVRLPEVRRSKRVQLGLAGERSRRDAAASTAAAVSHVRATFGDGAVLLASQVAEPRWKSVRRAYSAANGWTWL